MDKTAFYQIVGDNSKSTLRNVMLSNGKEIRAYTEIEGNRTTEVELFLYKIADEYITIRKHTIVTYDYNGQNSKGDENDVDIYLGYDSVIGLQYAMPVVRKKR